MSQPPPRSELGELAPFVRRCAELDPQTAIRMRVLPVGGASITSAFAMLPFGALVERSVTTGDQPRDDTTYRAGALSAWLGDTGQPPVAHDQAWRGSLPPLRGWARVETVPDAVVRDLVRTGALAAKEAAAVERLPGGQPSDSLVAGLLDAVVLTLTGEDGRTAQVQLRSLTAATRMGFVARGSSVGVDVAGRWTRVAATYGNVYAESAPISPV